MGSKTTVYIAGVAYDNDREKENIEAMIDKALSGIQTIWLFYWPITLNSLKKPLNVKFR
ncbi:MAG: hypothetical protein ACLUPK_04570 [Veillonella sp.]